MGELKQDYERVQRAFKCRRRAERALVIAILALCLALLGLAMVLGWL